MKTKLGAVGLVLLFGNVFAQAQASVGYGGDTVGGVGLLGIGYLAACLVFGVVGAVIGKYKNRKGFLYGFFLWFVGLIILAVLPKRGAKCPHCGGIVESGYSVCKSCGRSILPSA